jgi:hypothetical protein
MSAHRKSAHPQASDHLEHATINPISENSALPKIYEASPSPVTFAEAALGHDFSRVPLHAEVPVQRTPSCSLSPTRSPFGGACLACSVPVQAKLKIGQPDDKYEREADQVADMVMSMPEPRVQRQVGPEEEEEDETVQTKPLTAQITPLVQRQPEPEEEEEEEPIQAKLEDGAQLQRQEEELEEEEEEPIQTKQVGGQTPQVSSNLEAQIHSLRGGGQPLPESARALFEPRLGYSFSQVRVHSNQSADKAARAINARAFTSGRDIWFASGRYSSDTSSGRHLLAHELVHMVQQTRGFAQSSIGSPVMPGGRIQRKSSSSGGTACKVKKFKLAVGKWERTWPTGSGFHNLQLPVDFELELDSSSSKSDCLIGQDKMGRVEYQQFKSLGGISIPIIKPKVAEFSSWTPDADPKWPNRYWWDGKKENYSQVSWSWLGKDATFKDAPGFAVGVGRVGPFLGITGMNASNFPIYYGGVGKKGHFRFRTYVKDARTKATVKQLNWGLLIDYDSPSKGRHYFYL